jgi:hypothetical protein
MPITREESYSAEAAQLMNAMNNLCDGHGLVIVLAATGNMFASAIHNGAKMQGIQRNDDFRRYARKLVEEAFLVALANFNRTPKADDVLVKPQ